MSSAALLALQNAINTNTLTAAQQAALSEALDAIIPTFPSPDELSNSIPPTEGVLAREWIAVLYTIQAEGGGGSPVPPTFGTLIEPNAAALTAVDVTSLPNGQPAVVESYGAEFSLQPKGTLVVDGPTGGTVLASSDPTRVWERGDTVIAETAAAQTGWVVDPQNVSGTASNENTGVDGTHALLSKSEIMRRYGSWSPDISGIAVLIGQISADTTGTDPSLFTPNLIEGATFTIEGFSPPAAFTGTLNVVTPKSQTGNQALESSFTTTTGAISAGMLLTNTTRGNSVALVGELVGAGVWLISQPLTPYAGGTIPNPSEVDTWVHGDAITGVVPVSVDIAHVGGAATSYDPAFSPSYVLRSMTIVDSDPADLGAGTIFIEGSANFYFDNCLFVRNVSQASESVGVLTPAYGNCGFMAQANLNGRGNTRILGGFFGVGNTLIDCVLDLDVAMLGDMALRDCLMFGSVYYDTGTTLTLENNNNLAGLTAGLYGKGQLNNQGILITVAAAATSLPGATLLLNGNSNAYSNETTGGLTAVHLVPLTTAHLDAAAGAAGFGGMAWNGGCGISINGTAP